MARGGLPVSPLPQRHGVDAQRFRLPQDGPWTTLRDHLVDRLALTPDEVDLALARGDFVDARGHPMSPQSPFLPRSVVWAHRELPDETPPPEDVQVIHEDDRIVVIDKPHLMATMPRGAHIRYSALARTRVLTGRPRLAPAHRLDRPTAGLVLMTTEQRWRGPYQQLFAAGQVHKEYLALAPVRPDLELPVVRRTHVAKEHGTFAAREVPGIRPNAETRIELESVSEHSGIGTYRLFPRTGRSHQLRCQLSGLGIPIIGDELYPEARPRPVDDFTVPLRLLAAVLEFTDPVDGVRRRFETTRCLAPPTGCPVPSQPDGVGRRPNPEEGSRLEL